MTRPNILWICTDQQRQDTLGCYGNQFVTTPALDALAAGGVRFTNAFSQSPVCTPSRVGFLTGRYPVTARGRQNGADIPETERLITKILQENGYTCGLSGKLHISACNPRSGRNGVERRIDDGYSEFHWSHDTSAAWGESNEYHKWLSSQGRKYETERHPESRWVEYGMPEELHQTTWCVDRAIDFINSRAGKGARAGDGGERNHENPWLFSVNIYDPHHPFNPPREYLDRYLQILDSIPLPDFEPGEISAKTPWHAIDHDGAYGHDAGYPYSQMSDRDHRLVRAAYWAMCDLIDRQVGRMLEALDSTGQRENTIVIFMSDHGELIGDHGVYLKGPFMYDCSIRVPLVISLPGTINPARRDALVELVDIPATLLDLCEVPIPEGMQGRSFAQLLRGGTPDKHRDSVYSEYYNAMPWHRNPLPYVTAVRTSTEKLVIAHRTGKGEMYDLAADPRERRNLWDDPSRREMKLRLFELAADRMAETIDPLPGRVAPW